MKPYLLLAVLAGVLSACAPGQGLNLLDPLTPLPTDADAANAANYGSAPLNAPDLVRAFYRARLVDPESARYEMISAPVASWAVANTGKVIWGHRVCVRLNAKNRMGGYAGAQTDAIFFKGNQVSGFVENASEICSGASRYPS
jgi:hypothetical protein